MYRNKMLDNNSYNVLMAYVSTLEALEAFQKYSQDGNEQLWQQVSQHTEQVAQLLQRELPKVLQGAQASQSQSQGQGMQQQPGQSYQGGMQSGQSSMGGQSIRQ